METQSHMKSLWRKSRKYTINLVFFSVNNSRTCHVDLGGCNRSGCSSGEHVPRSPSLAQLITNCHLLLAFHSLTIFMLIWGICYYCSVSKIQLISTMLSRFFATAQKETRMNIMRLSLKPCVQVQASQTLGYTEDTKRTQGKAMEHLSCLCSYAAGDPEI